MPKTFHNRNSLRLNFVIMAALPALILTSQSCTPQKNISEESKIDLPISKSDQKSAEQKLLELVNSSSGKERLTLLNKLADFRLNKPPAEQELLITEIVQLAREQYGAESKEFAEAQMRQGRVQFRLKQFEKSAESWKNAAAIFEKMGEEFRCQQMECVSGQIAGECATGKCLQETALYEKLLALRRKCRGDKDQLTMLAVMLLGENYSRTQRYDDALKQFQEYADWTKTRSSGEQNAANLNIARTYIRMKQFKKAEPVLKSCLEFAQAGRSDGMTSPMLAPVLKTYILYYDKQKMYKEELATAKKLLEVNEKQIGPKHPQLPNTLMIYVEALEKAGKKKEAELVMNRIREIETSPEFKNSGLDSSLTK